MPAAGAAGQGERGAGRDERCAKRRREENAAVVPTSSSNAALVAAVRHAAVSEASRRASGARSDAPSFIVWLTALVSILGTAISITVSTVVSIGVTGIGIGSATNIATNISDVIVSGAGCPPSYL